MGKFNEYSQKATPADNDTLMIYDATSKANKLSPFSGIWNWIVGKLTNAVISDLQTNNKTVLGAINELNSKVFFNFRNLSTFSVKVELDKGIYTSFLMYGSSSANNGFLYIVFINTVAEKRVVNFIKIVDFAASRTFSGSYSDDTSTLTIESNETVWGGIKLLMIK
jgi:hypothetical protein